MLWVRWALRRLGYFAQGRPETLIRDLVGDPHGQIIFYAGDLTARLQSANLPGLEAKHARAIGVAVGQRAAMDTFNVRIEGVNAVVADHDLRRWPAAYRLGVATGLLFSPDEVPTITARNVHQALQVCPPVRDASEDITSMIYRVIGTRPPGALPGEDSENRQLLWFVQQSTSHRPKDERDAWEAIARHVRGW